MTRTTNPLKPRMENPAVIVPNARQTLYTLTGIIKEGNVPSRVLDLVNLRASQINGCSFCVEMHANDLKKAGETDERIFAIAACRESPRFTEAERAALALTEAATRIADCADAVSDEIWEEVGRHYDESALASSAKPTLPKSGWAGLN